MGFKVQPKGDFDDLPSTVDELFDQENKIWNLGLLKNLFEDSVVEAIVKIDIPMFQIKDKLCWLPSPDGSFTVKTSYHLEQAQNYEILKSSHEDTLKRIWKSDIHDRLKVFLWRCIENAIPMRSILAMRFHIDSEECILCGGAVESAMHLFFECHFAKALWFQCWGFKTEMMVFTTLTQWIEYFIDMRQTMNSIPKGKWLLAAAVIMEDIWKARNIKFKGMDIQPICNRRAAVMSKFFELSVGNSNLGNSHVLPTPMASHILIDGDPIWINFDVAIRDSYAVAACCFREINGSLLQLVAAKIPHSDSDTAEARAAKMAVAVALDKGWGSIHMESDSLNTVSQMKGRSTLFWKNRAIMEDINGRSCQSKVKIEIQLMLLLKVEGPVL